MIVEGETLVAPLFEIATNPQWHMREGLHREEEIISRAKDSISRQEDHEILAVISAGVPTEHTLVFEDRPTTESITDACKLIWAHEIKIHNIVYHPLVTDTINAWINSERDSRWPLGQSVGDINLLSCTMCPSDTIYVLAHPSMVGRIRVGVDVNVLECNDPKHLSYGRIVWESIGICLINDYCTAKICVV
jgi:hypothetical protein